MFTVSATDYIAKLVEGLPSHESCSYVITLQGRQKNLYFLFNKETNYTKVFFAKSSPKPYSDLKWNFLGSHDSCWRDMVDKKLKEEFLKLDQTNDERLYVGAFCPEKVLTTLVPYGLHVCEYMIYFI